MGNWIYWIFQHKTRDHTLQNTVISVRMHTRTHICVLSLHHVSVTATFDWPTTRLPPTTTLVSQSQVKVKVILRPTVSRPVRLGVRNPSETRDQFFPFSLWLFFRQFRVCWCGEHRTENTASKSSSIVAWVRCLAMALVVLRIYEAVVSLFASRLLPSSVCICHILQEVRPCEASSLRF
jgi:hypothetical protein